MAAHTSGEDTPQSVSELLTLAEASAAYRIPQATLRRWRLFGTGPTSFLLGNRVFYERSEWERWVKEQRAATSRGGAA